MSLLIKNVFIDNGDKAQDVLISGNKISSIGNIRTADKVIDGKGGRITPGFIDIDTTSDHYLSIFAESEQANFLRQGVTTQLGGQCGSSLAPLLYGTLESIRKWVDPKTINVDWDTVSGFLTTLQNKKPGINFGTLVGHSTVRRALIGEEDRDLTENELAVFKKVLKESLAEGAFGLSVGLEYAHSQNTPYKELKELFGVVAEQEGLVSMHLRSTGKGIEMAVEEAISLARDSGARIVIAHFMPLIRAKGEYINALEKLRQARRNDVDIYATMYPFDTSTLPIYRLLPRELQKGNLETMFAYVDDKEYQDRIASQIPNISASECSVVGGTDSALPFKGLTLKELMDDFGVLDSRHALVRLMQESKLKAVVQLRNIDFDIVRTALKEPFVVVASHASGGGGESGRSTRTFLEFLRLAREDGLLDIHDALKKITTLPANILRLKNRGILQEGGIADLAILKNNQITTVVIGGKLSLHDGVITGKNGLCVKKAP